MVEQFKIFGWAVELSKGSTSFRVHKLLLKAKLRTVLGFRRFSGSENLLYSLAADPYVLPVFFAPHGLSAKFVRRMQYAAKHGEPTGGFEPLSLKRVMLLASIEAQELSHDTIGVEHLLLALLRHDANSIALIDNSGLTYDEVREAAKKGLSSMYFELTLPRPRFYRARMSNEKRKELP